jgi:DNA-directed RNA polymerase alpha subunit
MIKDISIFLANYEDFNLPLFSLNIDETDRVSSDCEINEFSIIYLDLPIRAINVLKTLDIKTIYELIHTPVSKIYMTKNCGIGTCKTIIKKTYEFLKKENIQIEHISGNSDNFTISKEEALSKKVTKNSLQYFPLFGFENQEVDLGLLHPSYKANTLLTQMDFSVRANNIFVSTGMITLGELLNTNSDYLIKLKNFGKSTLLEIRTKINECTSSKLIGQVS